MNDEIHLRKTFTYHPTRGTLEFLPVLQNASAFVTYRDARGQSHTLALAGNQVTQSISDNL